MKESNKQLTQDMALNIDEVRESIDDAETDGDEQVVVSVANQLNHNQNLMIF